MIVDLVMWTKNGAATLPTVLERIHQVIPPEIVNKRLIVDDKSTDKTREIAQSFGWSVIFNEGSGISDGANTALKNVESEYFVSFEQDILLSFDWWRRISKLVNEGASVASGVRIIDRPKPIGAVERFTLTRIQGGHHKEFVFGKTLDNTCWCTSVIREFGFPVAFSGAGIDTVLAFKLEAAGYRWIVDYNCVSVHLRSGGLIKALMHYRWYGEALAEITPFLNQQPHSRKLSYTYFIIRFSKSILTGPFLAFTTRTPAVCVCYPFTRLLYLIGYIRGKRRCR